MTMSQMLRLRFELHARKKIYHYRVAQAQRLVKDTLAKSDNPYIAFSTGKDSLVMAYLVWEQAPDAPAVYFDADCSYPESRELLQQIAQEHPLTIWPTEPLLDTFERLGGPTAQGIEYQTMKSTVYEPIERLLNEFHFDCSFVGLRAEESWGRKQLQRYRGGLFWHKQWSLWECCPVISWGYNDIWAYVVSNKLEYCKVYDRLWDAPEEDQRLSYWAGETKHRYGRWAWLRQLYPGLYNEFVDRFPEIARYT